MTFKVVKLMNLGGEQYGIGVEVYSFRCKSWKQIAGIPEFDHCAVQSGVFVDGANAVHWLAWEKDAPFWINTIAALDLEAERFSVVPLPAEWDEDGGEVHHVMVELGALEGCLCLCEFQVLGDYNTTCLWVMKDYGIKESWSKLFSIEDCCIEMKPVAYLHSSRQLLVIRSHVYESELEGMLHCYNLQEKSQSQSQSQSPSQSVRSISVSGLPESNEYLKIKVCFCPRILVQLEPFGGKEKLEDQSLEEIDLLHAPLQPE